MPPIGCLLDLEFVRAAKCVGEDITFSRGHGSRPRVADDQNPHGVRLPAGIVRIVVAQDADEARSEAGRHRCRHRFGSP